MVRNTTKAATRTSSAAKPEAQIHPAGEWERKKGRGARGRVPAAGAAGSDSPEPEAATTDNVASAPIGHRVFARPSRATPSFVPAGRASDAPVTAAATGAGVDIAAPRPVAPASIGKSVAAASLATSCTWS